MGNDYDYDACLEFLGKLIGGRDDLLASDYTREMVVNLGVDPWYYEHVCTNPCDPASEIDERIEAMWIWGATSREIVDELGVSHSRVAQVLREMRDE